MTTPIRRNLTANSRLKALVKGGLQALGAVDRRYIADEIRASFTDSLDIDNAFRLTHGQANRWDYVLGHKPSGNLFGLEPHFATDGEISTVIRKRKNSKAQLGDHLKPGKSISNWFWVASSKVDFTSMDKARLRLDANGIEFVGKQLLKKHLELE